MVWFWFDFDHCCVFLSFLFFLFLFLIDGSTKEKRWLQSISYYSYIDSLAFTSLYIWIVRWVWVFLLMTTVFDIWLIVKHFLMKSFPYSNSTYFIVLLNLCNVGRIYCGTASAEDTWASWEGLYPRVQQYIQWTKYQVIYAATYMQESSELSLLWNHIIAWTLELSSNTASNLQLLYSLWFLMFPHLHMLVCQGDTLFF